MTAPAPTACPRCGGIRIVAFRWGGRSASDWIPEWCEECTCAQCGHSTDTPPLCARCQLAQDDADAAQAYREGR